MDHGVLIRRAFLFNLHGPSAWKKNEELKGKSSHSKEVKADKGHKACCKKSKAKKSFIEAASQEELQLVNALNLEPHKRQWGDLYVKSADAIEGAEQGFAFFARKKELIQAAERTEDCSGVGYRKSRVAGHACASTSRFSSARSRH